MNFLSDNAAATCPEVIDAVCQANRSTDHAYDGDDWSERLNAAFTAFFGEDCQVFAVSSGTAANALALSVLVPPYGAIVCHAEAHIQVDECGAPEFFSGGAKLLLCPGEHGKLSPDALSAALSAHRGDVHQVQVRALSLTQATECGTVYTVDELAALSQYAHERGWRVHMDGARYANAMASLKCHPGDISACAGVDILSFGTIKNGGMSSDAIVVFDAGLADDLRYRRKRAGQMPSKGRFHAAQLLAMIETGAFLRNATSANDGASQLAQAAGERCIHPVQANELFVALGTGGPQRLRELGFNFYDWGADASNLARFVVAWDTPASDIEALAAALRAL